MAWSVEWGSQIPTLLEMQHDTGITPKALLNRPELSNRWVYPKSVFDELSGSRQYTMGGPAEIPITAFFAYAVLYGFTRVQAVETWEDVAIIDGIWLSEVAKRQAANKKGT